jgi:hypothetical protein
MLSEWRREPIGLATLTWPSTTSGAVIAALAAAQVVIFEQRLGTRGANAIGKEFGKE